MNKNTGEMKVEKKPYFFVWPNTLNGKVFTHSFGMSAMPMGHVSYDSIEFLTPEEIGQELGGN